jgi:PAS domain S-box-containing protein
MTGKGENQDRLIQALKASEERYRFITQTSVDAIITTKGDDLVLTWNRGAEETFGFGPEIIGRSVTAIIPPQYRAAHEAGVKRFLTTGEKHILDKRVELSGLKQTGAEFPIELSLSTWASQGETYFGAIIRDITERKQVERLRDDVNRIMRHDLKSPLIGITGLAGRLLKEGGLNARQQHATAMIQTLGEKVLALLDRTRDLFQMEEGTYVLNPRPVDLLGLLKEVELELTPLAMKKNVRIILSGNDQAREPGAGYMIQGEAGLLEIMLANLIKNAVEAAPENSAVTVTFGPDEQATTPGHYIDIHNLGCIPMEIRGRFFDPYATSGKAGGTGLGTHSARLVARSHQGDIVFTTSETEGTHLTVRLPRIPVSPED